MPRLPWRVRTATATVMHVPEQPAQEIRVEHVVAVGDGRHPASPPAAVQHWSAASSSCTTAQHQHQHQQHQHGPRRRRGLVRWQHPHGVVMFPDAVIPLPEHSGLIGPLTQHVLDAALTRVERAWHARRPTPGPFTPLCRHGGRGQSRVLDTFGC